MRIVLALALLSAAVPGQQQMPLFRGGARLVEVTVAVLDNKGNPVAGLSQSDFTVEDGGKARPIAFFRYDGVPAKPAEAPRLTPGLFTNRTDEGGAAPPSVTALVLDTLNTPQEQSAIVRTQMMRYLKALGPASRVAIFIMGWDLRVLYDFTGNSDVLRARMEKVTLGAPPETVTDYAKSTIEAEEFLKLFEGTDMYPVLQRMLQSRLEAEGMSNVATRRNRMDTSLAGMEALGQRLAGIPGRKNLIWMSSGFSMASVNTMGMGVNGEIQNFEGKVRKTSQRLAQNGVVLYIVDPGGVGVPAQSSAGLSAQPSTTRGRGGGGSSSRGAFDQLSDSQDMSSDTRGAMTLMTSITGGRYLYNTNDLTIGFRQTLADLRGSYTVAFYAPEAPDNKWHKLKVKVNRSGVNLRHRQGYQAEAAPPQPVEWDEQTWKTAFSNPVGSSVIPLNAKCERTAAGEISVTLSIDSGSLNFRPDGENLRADVQVALWDGSGHSQIATLRPSMPAAEFDASRSEGIVFTGRVKPAQGAAAIRAVVHDMRTGQYGTLDIPVNKVPASAR